MINLCFGNTNFSTVTRRSTNLSTAIVCLTASLLSLRAVSLHPHRFSLRLAKTTCGRIVDRMATSTALQLENIVEVAPDTPSKLLLHEKDGSFFKRDEIGTMPFPATDGLKIISWNVAGLRGTLKKSPEVLNDLVDKEKPDILCLQNIGDFTDLLADRGYKSYWTFSEIKKGYAGTVLFIKEIIDPSVLTRTENNDGNEKKEATVTEEQKPKKKPKKQSKMSSFLETKATKAEIITESNEIISEIIIDKNIQNDCMMKETIKGTILVENVLFVLPDKRFNGEGRWAQLETPDFYFINTYVPNSGQNLERLDYRVDEWEPYVRDYLNKLREKKPVIFSGDLNVAHSDLDVYNYQAKHLLKQAGTTLREKNAFSTLLSTGFHDALRYLYPTASGQFTYWSMRTRARPFNKGLRLDYFVCSKEMFTADSHISCNSNSSITEIEVEMKVEMIKEVKADKIEDSTSNIPTDILINIKESCDISNNKIEKEIFVAVKDQGRRKRKIEIPSPVTIELIEKKKFISNDEILVEKKYENLTNIKVIDSYILPDINDCSDHCPIVLVLQKQQKLEK